MRRVHEHTPAASSAIEARERRFTQSLWVDWNHNGLYDHPLSDLTSFIVSTQRDQALTSTTPDEVMLIEGHAAAKLSADIAGELNGMSLAAHFAPYNGRSVFYTEGITLGVAVVYDIIVHTVDGAESYRQFTGMVQDITTDRETGTVTLDCLDHVERMRGGVDIPPYGLWQGYMQQGHKRGLLADSSSLIDFAARAGGFSMGPIDQWARWNGNAKTANHGAVVSVPYHGSILPEVGMLDNDQSFHRTELWETQPARQSRAEAWIEGPHGYLARNAVPRGAVENYTKYWFDEWKGQAGHVNGTWIVGAWIYWTGADVDEGSALWTVQVRGNTLDMWLRSRDGGIEARIHQSNGVLVPGDSGLRLTDPGWYYVEVLYQVHSAQHYIMRARVNDTYSRTMTQTQGAAHIQNDRLSGLVTVQHKYAISDFYVAKANFTDALDMFTYNRAPAGTARVSWGRNRLAYTLRESGREAWELAKELGAAEFGTVFFDEYGRFVFWNHRDILDRQTSPARSFTLDDLQSLSVRNTWDSVRNVWSVTTRTAWARLGIAWDMGRDGVPLWRRGSEYFPADFRISPQETEFVYFPVADTVIAVNPWHVRDVGEHALWDEHAPRHGRKSFQGTQYRGVGGSANSEQKLITRDMAWMAIRNDWTQSTIGFVGPNGEFRIRVEGTLVDPGEPSTWQIHDEDSIAFYGERVLELENFWLQDEWQTRRMLTDVASRMGRPIPVSDDITVPGDPRIQLGDTVELHDRQGFGERMTVQIQGITREFSPDAGLRDTYSVEQVESAGVGIWDSPTYGLWDQSLIWR